MGTRHKHAIALLFNQHIKLMTSGFEFLVESISSTLLRSSKLKVHLDEDSLDMLDELVQGQAYDVVELATDLLTKAIHEYYQATSEKVQRRRVRGSHRAARPHQTSSRQVSL